MSQKKSTNMITRDLVRGKLSLIKETQEDEPKESKSSLTNLDIINIHQNSSRTREEETDDISEKTVRSSELNEHLKQPRPKVFV